ncbi:diguanylate cyclase [Acidovorax sp. LjRoot118]|uniref:GGDEF domain-containing protein n=1 Tax=Acidovorax sp. LjRoot118 TaxID=3342256 RepID=UPI003ECC6BCB
MSSPSDKPLSPAAQAARLPRHQRGTYWLLALVLAMVVATSVALWWTLRQAQSLAQPFQKSDLWYVSSVHSELGRVALLARKVKALEAPEEELRERLEVLYSTLDMAGASQRIGARLRQDLAQPALDLEELGRHVKRWSSRMASAPPERAGLSDDIIAHTDALLQSTRKAVVAVHLFSSQDTDRVRQELHDHFMLLSAVLGGLLIGTALLIRKLLQEARAAQALSQQLAQANRQLEMRVASRTREIDENRALLGFILDSSPSDVVLADVESGFVHFINNQMVERLGLQWPPMKLFLPELLHDPATSRQLMDALEKYGQVDGMEALIGTRKPRWSSLSARLIEVDGRLAHLLWGFDISTHKQLESQLRELATRDSLTGLLNRRAFLERGTALLDHCRRHAKPCAVLMIDIDHFKRINDRYGHQTGDDSLRACATSIAGALREADILGRLGGEEFAALLPHSSTESAHLVAERIRDAISQLQILSIASEPLRITVSIGMAEMAHRDAGIETILAWADQALYRAKATGRNKVLAYERSTPSPDPTEILP